MTASYYMVGRRWIVYVSLIICLELSQVGCVAVQTFPLAARSGDTVTMAVGSAEGMTRENTSIVFVSDQNPGVEIPIPDENISSIFPLYPDKRSQAWSNSSAISIDTLSLHGSWVTVLVLELPDLPEGAGVFRINTSAVFPDSTPSPNDYSVSVEILPGSGQVHPLEWVEPFYGSVVPGNLSALEPVSYYRIRPDIVSNPLFSNEWPLYGAAEIIISGSLVGASETVIDDNIRVVLEDMEEHLKSVAQLSWYRRPDSLVVNIISTKGKLNYFEVNTSLFFVYQNIDFVSSPTVSVRYFSIEGGEVAGPPLNIELVTN